MPSRTVERLTPNCLTSSASVPSGSPARSSPERMRFSIASATSRYAGVVRMRGSGLPGNLPPMVDGHFALSDNRTQFEEPFPNGRFRNSRQVSQHAGFAAAVGRPLEEEMVQTPETGALLSVRDVGVRFG